MKFFATASVLVAIASTALAKTQGCLSTKQASQLVSRFSSLLSQSDSDLGDYNTTGKAILAKEYIEVSDSILSLTQRPVSYLQHVVTRLFMNGTLTSRPAWLNYLLWP